MKKEDLSNDPELKLLLVAAKLLTEMNYNERRRVLVYLFRRFIPLRPFEHPPEY